MLKSMSTTASSVAAVFLAACTTDIIVVHQVLGAAYDLQVHTCADIQKAVTSSVNGGVGVKFCTEDQECTTSLLAAPLSNGGSITDVFDPDTDYTFTLSLGSGVSTMELSIIDNLGWCFDQLSLGPTGGTLEQLQATAVWLDSPCETDEDIFYHGASCVESLQYAIGPVVSTTEDLYSLTITTCGELGAASTAIPILSACEVDDCHDMLLYELYGEEAPGREVNDALDVGETVEWLFWLEAPPSELRLSIFGQLGIPTDEWCFAGVTFEVPVGGTALNLSTGNNWLDAPCEALFTMEGGCEVEYVFDLTAGASSTPAPSAQASEVDAVTPAPTANAATDAEEPSPAPTASSRGLTSPPTTEEEEAITPAPATTDNIPEDVSDQDTTSSAAGRYYAPVAAWVASPVFIAVVTLFG